MDISRHKTVYETMNACHLDFIEKSRKANAAMIFFSPDALWSNDSLRYALDQVESAKRAILIAGVRAEKEATLIDLLPLRARLLERGLTGQELVSLLVKHPHRITESLTWRNPEFDIGWPSHLYSPIEGRGYVGRCFHLHTFFVNPHLEAKPEVAHDFDWLDKIGLKGKEVSLVCDSDQIFALELSAQDRGINGRIGERTMPALADWVRRYAAKNHRFYARNVVYFHTGDRFAWAWRLARLKSGIVIRMLLLLALVQSWLNLELKADGTWVRTVKPKGCSSTADL
jgi:hypothetical protein